MVSGLEQRVTTVALKFYHKLMKLASFDYYFIAQQQGDNPIHVFMEVSMSWGWGGELLLIFRVPRTRKQ